jgi:hypothetical protein
VLPSLLCYLAFASVALAAPGVALQRLARTRIDAALVLPLGIAWAAALQQLSLIAGLPWVHPAATLALSATLLLRLGPWSRAENSPPLRGALAPLLGVIGLLAVTAYPLNRYAADGRFLLDPMGDHPLHVGITHELVQGHPPQVPGLAGVRLVYHVGADLVRAAALRWAGVEPYDAINRFEVTLYALALILALRGAAAMLGTPPLALALAPWTLLATDLSFLLAAFVPGSRWWADLLRGNLLLSLVFDNPVVPALALALGALIALSRYEAGEGRGWLPLALVQAGALPWFKVFLGAHLLLGLLAALVFASRSRRRAALLTALATLPGLIALTRGGAGGRVVVELAPLQMVRDSLANLGLEPPSGLALLGWSGVWLLASLGVRALGVPLAWRGLRSPASSRSALAAMALAGWPLGLLAAVSARDLAGAALPSATIYFVEQSGCVLWLFAAIAVAGLAQRWGRAAVVPCCALLALPATLELALTKAREPPDPLPASVTRAMRALRENSRAGDVVVQRPSARYPPPAVILAGRRVPYERFTPYLTQFASRELLEARHEAVHRFFRARDPAEALGLARGMDARFVCLYGSDRVRFDAAGLLEPIHEEAEARCYRIRAGAAGSPGPSPGGR